jgi:hypothetical protein
MSDNFKQVKNDILEEMRTLPQISGDAWADIMLRHSRHCVTDDDQISFWNFILNPFNRRDFVKPEYVTGEDPIECHIAPEQDENVENKYMLNGGTLFVNTSTVDDEKDDDEKSQDDEKDSSK